MACITAFLVAAVEHLQNSLLYEYKKLQHNVKQVPLLPLECQLWLLSYAKRHTAVFGLEGGSGGSGSKYRNKKGGQQDSLLRMR
jgi:hypothetical protein